MLVANFVSNNPSMGSTRTLEDFGKLLGTKTYKLGILAKLYPQNTISALTDLLGNVWMGEEKKKMGGFQSIDSDFYEWEIETNQIKRVPFAAVPVENGADGSEIEMIFPENYYQLHEIFKIEESGQQCFVVAPPTRKADNMWSVLVRLIDDDYSSVLDPSACQIGMMTRWIGNAKPELNDCGFTKYTSNVEKMRNCMTLIRVDETYSAKYKLMEDTLIKIGQGANQGCLTETIYRMDPMKKVLMDNFMLAREQMLLLAKGNVNVDGKATISDRATGRQIPIGEGLIPQLERFCSKHVASKVTINTFQTVISQMVQKAENPVGNHFIFVANEQMWTIFNRVLFKFLADFKTDGALFYSKTNGIGYKVGATFSSYEFAGNTVSFTVNRALTREYTMPFAMCIDFTGGKTNANPPVNLYTLKGKDLIFNTLKGVGMEDGEVASMVAGGAMTAQGYASIAVTNPYRSFLLYSMENPY